LSAEIVFVGGINMDLTVWVDRLPAAGETVRGERILQHPGGKGANQAVAAARAGAAVGLVGRLGRDGFGDELLAGFERDGVDASGVTRDPDASTGVALIGVDATGQNTITVGAGANGRVSLDDLDRSDELISGASFGVLNFEIPMPVVMEAARRFHDAGARLVLNLSPLYPVPEQLLGLIDLLIVNDLEAASVVGESHAPPELLERIRALGVSSVVITLGPEGAVFDDDGQTGSVTGYPVEAVDPTAAGDAFLGTLLADLVSGSTMNDACRRANAAGALAVSRAGAQPSIPTREEVDSALVRWSGVGA
jgi:ribokinase